MCDPLTIGSIALTLGSAGANYMAQNQVDDARSGALAAERIRQGQYDQEAAALNTQSQGRYEDFGAKQGERAKSLGEMFTAAPAELPPTAAPMPASSSNLVVQAENKARGEARDRTNQIGGALGNLRSFADLLGDTSRLQGRDASQIGQIGGFKKGSSAVLGQELEAANSAGGGTKMLGDILGGLGRVGMMAGLSGAGGGLFGSGGAVAPSASPATYGAAGSMSLGRALDRASVPGYAGYAQPGIFSIFGSR